MSEDHRHSIRVYPRDFKDYDIFIQLEFGDSYNGHMGNVSETGLCCIMPEQCEVSTGDALSGYIQHIPMGERISFKGTVVWEKSYEFQKKVNRMLGIHFEKAIVLPDHLFALSLSVEPPDF